MAKLISGTRFRLLAFLLTSLFFTAAVLHLRDRSYFPCSSNLDVKKRESATSRSEERIALVLYGLPRATKLTHRSIKSKIYDVLQRESVEFDVILHHVLYLKPYSNRRNSELETNINNSEWKLLHPNIQLSSEHDYFLKSHAEMIEEVLTYGDPHHTDGESTRNELEALHSLKLATLVASGSEREYTGMIILRPDLIYHDDINVTLLRWAMSNGVIVTPGWHTFGALNDRFSFGAWEPMLRMGLRFNNILEFCRTTKRPWLAEEHVHWLIYKVPRMESRAPQHGSTLIHCHTTLTATRVRSNGKVVAENFKMAQEEFVKCL